MTTATTPWGKATSIESVSVQQRSGERRFTTRIELLEIAGGERLVRFSAAPSRFANATSRSSASRSSGAVSSDGSSETEAS